MRRELLIIFTIIIGFAVHLTVTNLFGLVEDIRSLKSDAGGKASSVVLLSVPAVWAGWLIFAISRAPRDDESDGKSPRPGAEPNLPSKAARPRADFFTRFKRYMDEAR